MNKLLMTSVVVLMTAIGIGAQQGPPPWAFTVNPPPTPGATPAPVDPEPKSVPGTTERVS